MRQLQLAVAGAGAIGRRHIELVQDSPRCRLTAIVDPGPAAAETAASVHIPLFRSLGELFEKNRPDGVILATPNSLHVEQALECIAAGCLR
jgi:predicted dehydrogenase